MMELRSPSLKRNSPAVKRDWIGAQLVPVLSEERDFSPNVPKRLLKQEGEQQNQKHDHDECRHDVGCAFRNTEQHDEAGGSMSHTFHRLLEEVERHVCRPTCGPPIRTRSVHVEGQGNKRDGDQHTDDHPRNHRDSAACS